MTIALILIALVIAGLFVALCMAAKDGDEEMERYHEAMRDD